ncbi:ABC transporter ATP-binding protein [Halalkalibacter krulwichiae]|uniref:ABC transporter ATP-binding protein YtrB n=1 Tax=Halalkalibacter krulwichiae TaxID=199441 RepID=A0A1X9M8B2_9BACI|nr:ABC transporter ATP-binding protein [Halalkalibacter krulwichiae]ARK29637.1 ABC transporter ATP-binding protein YtrB [Halalkalibacter krulwichiae]
MIKANNLCKEFDGSLAVDGITLSVEKGSIFGLLGSNGAGKTTLLKMLAGIYKPDTGEVRINNEPVFENVHRKQKMIFLADSLFFYPNTTIQQAAQFYQSMYSLWSEERFVALQNVFQIDPKKKIHRLSKGMQRQVAFWLTLSTMPDVLILDEPLDGLDAVMRKKIKNLLIQDVAEREMTILISSHNLREVEDVCDNVGIMHDGKMIIEKDLDDLKSDVHKIQVAFKQEVPPSFLKKLPVLYKEVRGSVHLYIVRGKVEEITNHVRAFKPAIFDILPLTLEEIFIYEMRDVGYEIENIIV